MKYYYLLRGNDTTGLISALVREINDGNGIVLDNAPETKTTYSVVAPFSHSLRTRFKPSAKRGEIGWFGINTDNIRRVVDGIRSIGNGGHSFKVYRDSVDKANVIGYWDGDGPDRVGDWIYLDDDEDAPEIGEDESPDCGHP